MQTLQGGRRGDRAHLVHPEAGRI